MQTTAGPSLRDILFGATTAVHEVRKPLGKARPASAGLDLSKNSPWIPD